MLNVRVKEKRLGMVRCWEEWEAAIQHHHSAFLACARSAEAAAAHKQGYKQACAAP